MNLSIAIVSYHTRDLLARCLASIQDAPPAGSYEIIVLDNASGDGTVEMLRAQDPDVRVIASDTNLGFAAGVNRALAQAQGETLVILNPDTEVRAGALDALAGFLRDHPEAGAVGPRLVGPAGELELSCHAFPSLGRALSGQLGLARLFPRSRLFGAYNMTWWDHAQARRVDWISGACLVVTRRAWDAVGPLDEGYFMYFEDVDWCRRLVPAGLQCWVLPAAEIMHHEAASWRQTGPPRVLASQRAAFRYFRKHHGRPAEITLRLMTGLGALLRAAFWGIAGPLVRRPRGVISDARLHLAVARLALLDESA
jgi:hypothetical protein